METVVASIDLNATTCEVLVSKWLTQSITFPYFTQVFGVRQQANTCIFSNSCPKPQLNGHSKCQKEGRISTNPTFFMVIAC